MSIADRRALWIAFLATIIILLYRAPERLLHGFVWAEDATVFMQGAYDRGWAGVFEPYSRYLHVLPHGLTTALAWAIPFPLMPYALAWTSAAAFAASNTYVFWVARQAMQISSTVGNWLYPMGFALAPALVPHSGEVFVTVANLQWVVAPAAIALVWHCFAAPAAPKFSPMARAGTAVVLALISISGPFGVFLWPLAAGGVLHRRSWRDRDLMVIFVCYTAACAAQGIVILGPYPPDPPLRELPWVTDFLTHQIADAFFPADVGSPGQRIAAGAIASIALIWVSFRNRAWFTCGVFGLLGMALWVAAMLRINTPDAHFMWFGGGARYTYVPYVLMAWTLLLAMASSCRPATKVAALMLAMMMLTSAGSFRVFRPSPWVVETRDGMTFLVAPPDANWRAAMRTEQ